MAGYKLATYQSADGPRAGVIIDDTLFDATKLTRKAGYATVLAILEDWKNAQALLKRRLLAPPRPRGKGRRAAAQGTKLLAPVRWPSAIYCAGANYATTRPKWPPARARSRNPIRTRRACSPGISSRLALARQSG